MNTDIIAYVPIKNCKECSNWFTDNYYSTDGWDHMEDWNCKLVGKKIKGAVEWHEEGKIPIPNWCPYIIKKIEDILKEKDITPKDFAIKCHTAINQMYDKNLPYEYHLEKTSEIGKKFIYLISEEERDEVINGCWVHDLLEDVNLVSYNDILKIIGLNLAEYSFVLKNEKGRNRKEKANEKYYIEIRKYKHASFIKLCDRIANSIFAKSKGNSMFKKYQSEHNFMKEHLYDGRYQELWDKLENILFT